jgi:hypothetical protein
LTFLFNVPRLLLQSSSAAAHYCMCLPQTWIWVESQGEGGFSNRGEGWKKWDVFSPDLDRKGVCLVRISGLGSKNGWPQVLVFRIFPTIHSLAPVPGFQGRYLRNSPKSMYGGLPASFEALSSLDRTSSLFLSLLPARTSSLKAVGRWPQETRISSRLLVVG